MSSSIPVPDEHALSVSRRLTELIRDEIDAAGGWIGFDHYMQRALYEPGLGYYSGGSVKFGAAGDFVTAPEISDVFGQALAGEIRPILERMSEPAILELGAGSGRLARSILTAFDDDASLSPRYQILEPSADLKERQRSQLATFGNQVSWRDQLPADSFEGVILANEVLDAFPVTRFVKRADHARPLGVGHEHGALVWAEGPADTELNAEVDSRSRLGSATSCRPGFVRSCRDVYHRGLRLSLND